MAKVCVLDLLFNWPPDSGGRVDTYYLLRYLAGAHDVELICPRMTDVFPRGRIDTDLGIPVRYVDIPDEVTDHREFCSLIRSELESRRPDSVIIADAWHLKARLMAALAPMKPIVRFYAHESLCLKGHGHQYRNEAVCPVNVLDDPMLRQTECLPCWRSWMASTRTDTFDRELQLADVEAEDFPRDLQSGLAAAKAAIVSNYPMVERLAPYTPRVVRQTMGVDPELFYPRSRPTSRQFLLFGRVYDYLKGGQVVLEAGRRLWQKRQDFTIATTGRPSRFTSDEQLASMPFLRVVEPVPYEQVPQVIDDAFACIVASLWPEPFPLVALEAMACGRPVIASDVGGLGELILDGANGLLTPPNDPAALAIAMERLLDDNTLTERLSCAGIETVASYHWSELHAQAYDPLLASE